MQSLESLKRQIHTAEDLHSVVKTMKALAAVNIRQLERAVDSLTDYNRTVELGFRVLLRHQPATRITARAVPRGRLGVIVFGSDQGMCGQLNDQITRYASQQLDEANSVADERVVLAVGARAASRMEDEGYQVESLHSIPSSIAGITRSVQQLLMHIEAWYTRHEIGRAVLYYCEHQSRATYRARTKELLPIDRNWLHRLRQEPWPRKSVPKFTMPFDDLFSALVRQYLFVSLYRAFAESMASENASRLVSMRGAERNIEDRITELDLKFHQQRQMTITEELLDIGAGFEALAKES